MAAQGIWSGTISFSLVAIPVRIVKAIEPGRISFHLLHKKDYSPLTRKMFCPKEEKIVAPEETIRGYEIQPDRYVVITDEELESVSPERSRTIEIVEFIDMKEVDPVYYDHPYYVVPSKGGEKAYQLLVEVMQRANKAGLAKFVLNEREYLVAVTPRDGALALITLHYTDETISDEGLSPKKEKISTQDEGRIRKSIERMIRDFNPEKYKNARQKELTALLKSKEKEKAPVEAPEIEEEEEEPEDLVAALEESMRKVKESR